MVGRARVLFNIGNRYDAAGTHGFPDQRSHRTGKRTTDQRRQMSMIVTAQHWAAVFSRNRREGATADSQGLARGHSHRPKKLVASGRKAYRFAKVEEKKRI